MAGGYGSKYLNGKFSRFIKLILPPIPIQNTISKKLYLNISSYLFRDNNIILNIGSGDKVGVGAKLWHYCKGGVVNLDVEDGINVDVIGDAHSLPFNNNEFDAVIMQAVLEHLSDPKLAIKEAFRVLKPNKYLYLEVPFLQGFHADPHDYFRFTQVGISELIKDHGHISLKGVSSGPFSSINWILRDLFSNLTPFPKFNLVIRFFISWIFFPIKYLDILIIGTKASERLACEYFYLIQKK